MAPSDQGSVTRLLVRWREGDEAALAKLSEAIFGELHRLARAYMRRERAGHLLETGALVNEAFLRLVAGDEISIRDRRHFFALAARLMRQVLVDYARSRKARKRGGDAIKVAVQDHLLRAPRHSTPVDLIALDEALDRLSTFDERKVKVVEMRFFAGLNVEETAEALSVSKATVMRDWRLARAWLRKELSSSAGGA